MASLVLVTQETRTILKYGSIISIFLIILFFVVRGLIYVQNVLYPKAPIAAKQEFGKLPHIIVPNQEAFGIIYNVNTVNGTTLPKLPEKVDVYLLVQPQPDLLALDKSRKAISAAYFTGEPVRISDSLYEWRNEVNGTNVQYDIVTKNFIILSNYLDDPSLASTFLLPDEKTIKRDTLGFLNQMRARTDDLDMDSSKITYLKLNGRFLIAADNLGNARYTRIDIKQKSVNDIPITYMTPTDSLLTFTISYLKNQFTVLEGQYIHHIPNLDKKSDYKIKTAEEAFGDLQNGKAYVINQNNLKNIEITNVELQYYLDKNTDHYLQPIIVFKGINFIAYVEAIPDEYLQ